ncbi:hypothetical protein LTR37_009271 [Vermiconidia calcicola]|uniref:Uncharacterized protein n=1 Tax=Vermiconidia calcicola TaxID=1690605 RepID=A0ACC3N827_9PEZI|nr:hypothetical protein LTR37_009271 [Vermiconidia calcicola]
MSNPFLSNASKPGHGTIHLALLPPNTPRLKTLNYHYPLKLISPAPSHAGDDLVHTVYLLTYGGGLVAGDSIDLHVTVEASTRLVLLTQGSTKLYRSPSRDVVNPVQPFGRSCFEQRQVYNIAVPTDGSYDTGSLCVLDWVSNGRPANGENWSFLRYGSKNEIYLCQLESNRRLLLRDNVSLDGEDIASRMDGLAVFGTLILYGPLFKALGQFFMEEFKGLPRIGGRKWDSSSESGDEDVDPAIVRRLQRQRQETADGLLWSAAFVRGCVVVKFGAREVEGGRSWLRDMLVEEGSVVESFGERALLCLR